jgi:hypothetical protein
MFVASRGCITTEPSLQALDIDKGRLAVLASGISGVQLAILHVRIPFGASANSEHTIACNEKLLAIRTFESVRWVHAACGRVAFFSTGVWEKLSTKAHVLRVFLATDLVHIPRRPTVVTAETPI